MPFVERDGGGNIVGLYSMPQPGRTDNEPLPEINQEVINFRKRTPPIDPNASLTVEELYDMLVLKGVVMDSDRPRSRP